jgi:hypothetical protein
MSSNHGPGIFARLHGSVIIASMLLLVDVIASGSFLLSFSVGPIWLLFAIFKVIVRCNDRPLAIKRIFIVLVTLGFVFGNAWLQSRIARSNAVLIIHACADYQAKNGVYPETLGELVPAYLHSVPRAKYALIFGDFYYIGYHGEHSLMWVEIPPFGRPYYMFEKAKWGYLD